MITSTRRIYSQSTYGIKYDKLKYHSLHHAVYDERIPQIQYLLKIHPELINYRTDLGLTPLMIACFLQDDGIKDTIITMLCKTIKLNPYETDHNERSVIFYLVNFATLSQLKYFLKSTKFNFIDETDNDGYTILHYAAVRENLGILEFVINLFKSYQININITNKLNYSPLLLCCKLKKYRSAAIIIKMGGTSFSVRDNENFRNCLEWLEYEERGNTEEENNRDKFYFNRFQIHSNNCFQYLMSIGIPRVSARHVDCFTMDERSYTSVSCKTSREGYDSTKSQIENSFYSHREKNSSQYIQSFQVQELQNMSKEDIKLFLIDSFKTGNKKLNRPKRVSIALRDKVYLPRNSINSTLSNNLLPYCRQSSAEIVHRLLKKLPMDYF